MCFLSEKFSFIYFLFKHTHTIFIFLMHGLFFRTHSLCDDDDDKLSFWRPPSCIIMSLFLSIWSKKYNNHHSRHFFFAKREAKKENRKLCKKINRDDMKRERKEFFTHIENCYYLTTFINILYELKKRHEWNVKLFVDLIFSLL